VAVTTACKPPKKESYDAPAITYDGKVNENIPLKIDSSIEKAVAKDSLKRRKYQL
jgi:hypothetical protein